ncbi:hypothetical protein DSM104299_03403 [Baekduia alba]|uniref:hypothetical protein n=1 Tax=Baekduia alba TaxID=2997333 RepID=UPI0023418432|nr:hypothetical protein [Baekduia alba]WCB94665.1 hypothetical protein DSM104299_03403 [Baekduia alba]
MWARRVTEASVAALLCLALLPPVAGARRDDLPTEPRTPVDGATVADATAGITVAFTCPPYHPTAYDDVVDSRGTGYHVILAKAKDIGFDGLLLGPNRVDRRDAVEVDGQPGLCTAAPDDAERGLLPTEPGTYWWQSYRDCATYLCAFGVEYGDPSAVTVTQTVCTANRTALTSATKELAAARAALKRRRSAGRRARVTRLDARVAELRARLRVVYRCAP